MKVTNLGKTIACDECDDRQFTQGVFDVIEVQVGAYKLRLCSRHMAEMLVLGRSEMPRERRASLAS